MNKVRNPAVSLGLLVVLIAASPVLAITPGWLGPQVLTLVVAVMLLLLPSAPQADVRRSLVIFKPLVAAVLFPVAWMLLQIFPVPLGSVEHPVWRSAAAALAEPLSGHISIDLGYTLRGLFGYLSLISLMFLTSVLTRNRDRAETILFALCAITAFIAVELILFHDLAAFKSVGSPNGSADSLVALAALGIIVNVAFVMRTVERYETRGQRQPQSWRTFVSMVLLGATGALICLVALIYSTTYDVLIAVAFGLAIFALVILLRRLSLGRWTAVTVCAAAFVACGGIIALRFAANPAAASPLFRFTRLESAETGAATLRMLSDANWAGSGVGSYPALAAIYRDAAGIPGQTVINTITSMALEWGHVGLLISIALLIQLLVVLFRGALSRGRDSFYAASAAACLVMAFCEAYCDASSTDVTVQMMCAIVIGMGLSQTTGHRAT